jgi:UPF0716 protein FxsA
MQKSLFPFVPFLLLVIPILEIGVFIIVGGQIGVINTLLAIVLTAFIGTILLRQQGFALLAKAQGQMDQGKLPGKELAHGVMLLAAGLLLLTPGFVTDTIGFLLLVPAVRDGIFAFFKARMQVEGFAAQQQSGFGEGGAYYERHSYTHYSSRPESPRPGAKDKTIIDLDEDDFNEVGDHPALEEDKTTGAPSDKKGSPWQSGQ